MGKQRNNTVILIRECDKFQAVSSSGWLEQDSDIFVMKWPSCYFFKTIVCSFDICLNIFAMFDESQI